MSAYSEVQTQFTDGELLIEALKELGYNPVNCIEHPAPLVGYQGDYRTADGNGHTTDISKAMKAGIIIPRSQVGGASNDIGFVKGEDGKFGAIISDYDSRRHGAEWLQKLRTSYAEKGILRQAKRAGLTVTGKKVLANGKIQYKFLQH